MSLLLFKIVAIILIFSLTLSTGFLPIRLAKKYSHILHYGDVFASGVFLSAALIHLLPDASISFNTVCNNCHYPLAELFCIATFLILLLIEKGMKSYCLHHNTFFHNHATPYLLILMLSIHSFIEGAAIGINADFAGAFLIFFAVIAHKGSESFALSSNLHRYSLPTKKIAKIMLLFSFITPLGILSASLSSQLINSTSGTLITAILNAVAAGTFLYIGATHIVEERKENNYFAEAAALIAGVALMSIVAIWV